MHATENKLTVIKNTDHDGVVMTTCHQLSIRLDDRTVDDVSLPVFWITISETFRKGVACDFQLSNL